MSEPTKKLVKPRGLTREIQRSIIEYLTRGNYLTTACEASGISYEGFRYWRVKWEAGDPSASEFDDFFVSIKRAVCVAETNTLDRLSHGSPGWQAQAWLLERRWPEKWGKKDRTPVPPKPAKPIEQMNAEELAAYERELDKGKDRA